MKKIHCFTLAATLFVASCGKDDPAPIPVGEVTLDKTALSLYTGEQQTLTATIAPAEASEKTIAWQSSDQSVATVNEAGVVTALTGGTTIVMAAAGGKSATCRVSVEPNVYVVGESLSPQYGKLWKNGVMTKLDMFLTPNSVYVSDGKVYITGQELGVDNALVWIDGELEQLGPAVPMSICVCEGDVYVTGYSGPNGYLWKNGSRSRMDEQGIQCRSFSVFVSGQDVYVGGDRQYGEGTKWRAAFWKNGEAFDLTDGAIDARVNSIVEANGVVYAVGYARDGDGDEKAVLWKHPGGQEYLAEGRVAMSVAVSAKGDVYIGGKHDRNYAAIWKNGVIQKLDEAEIVNSIFVYGDDVYAVGQTYSYQPLLWKNGVSTTLPYTNKARVTSVFVE